MSIGNDEWDKQFEDMFKTLEEEDPSFTVSDEDQKALAEMMDEMAEWDTDPDSVLKELMSQKSLSDMMSDEAKTEGIQPKPSGTSSEAANWMAKHVRAHGKLEQFYAAAFVQTYFRQTPDVFQQVRQSCNQR